MEATSPRVLLRGGRVWTPDHPHATALALEGGVISWVGDEAGAAGYVGGAHRVVDLGGALVTPGFVDAHVHLAATGLNAGGVDLAGARSRTEALELLAAHVRGHADEVVLGFGWDDNGWPDGRFGRDELDQATGGRVAYVTRVDVHSAIVSSALVRLAPTVSERAGWEPDGWVERDAHHEARATVDALISPAQRGAAIERALSMAAAAGIVAVHEMGAPHLSQPDDFATIVALADERPTPHVTGYWGQVDAYDLAAHYRLAGLAGDLCCDGALGSRTAALHAPYTDAPHTRGHLYIDAAQVRDHVVACMRRGLQAGYHVIGDRAVAAVVAGLEAAAEVCGDSAVAGARHRLEHIEMLSPRAIAVLARLGVVASVQPAFDAAWGGADGLYARRLGTHRAATMNPYADLLGAGVALAFGSDTPVTRFAPWAAIAAAVDHRTPGQAIAVAAAMTAHTAGGWWAAGESRQGILSAGRPATYAVWELPDDLSDPLAEGAAGLVSQLSGHGRPHCVLTVRAGRALYDATT